MRHRDLDLKSEELRKLLIEIHTLIKKARRQTFAAVNVGLAHPSLLAHRQAHPSGSERATYGERIVVTPSRQSMMDCGRGCSRKNLRRMVQFAEAFSEEEIVVTLSRDT
jgi:hypothetical protein